MSVPRGVLATYLSERDVVLCKAAPYVRDSYEVRLCLYMALKEQRQFLLVVRPEAEVSPSLQKTILDHGGAIRTGVQDVFTVAVGAENAAGVEGDVWVLGHNDALANLHRMVDSLWFAASFVPGAIFRGDGLTRLEEAVRESQINITNADGENVRSGILSLVDEARRTGGAVFVQ